jgi:RHS repeat-associated protein
MEHPGFIYIFLYNRSDSPNWVFFDDFKVTHQRSPIVAGADFYPFGLPMEGREITQEDYRWGYQGHYAEKDTVTGWNQFQLRMYDARFGRWLSVDPYKEFHSPYVGMGNMPNFRTDPTGGFTGGELLQTATKLLDDVITVTASRLPSIGSVVAGAVGRSIASNMVKLNFCPDCPDPFSSGFEIGTQHIFSSDGPNKGAVYELTSLDPSLGKNNWTRISDGNLSEIVVTPKKNFFKSFGAAVINPFVDVATTVWTSTRNGFKEYSNGEGKYEPWYSYKVDQDGFYKNMDKNGYLPEGSPERAAELMTNTLSVNLTVASWGVNFPISQNAIVNFAGNQAIKQPTKAAAVKIFENAVSIH